MLGDSGDSFAAYPGAALLDSQRCLVLSDLHIPFQDDRAVRLALQVTKQWAPDQVILAGDMLDFYAVSSHDKNPDRLKNAGLQDEIHQWRDFATALRDSVRTDTKIIFLPGNHEDRLRRYLWRDSALHGLEALALPRLLGLEGFGIEYAEYEVPLANGNLVVKHGSRVRPKAGQSAMAELEGVKYDYSTITGHTHRMGGGLIRKRRGVVGAWENGCLCDLNPEYVHEPDWQHGVSLIWHTPDEDAFNVQSLPFLGGKCLLEGKRVSV